MDSDAEAVAELSLPLVIEVTGHPDGLGVAVAAAAPGGRVVLLGSPRGLESSLPAEAIRRKELRVIGVHITGLKREPAMTHAEALEREARAVLEVLGDRRLVVSDLFNTLLDPREAAPFYRCLASDRTILAARFDWTGFPAKRLAVPAKAPAGGQRHAASPGRLAGGAAGGGATASLRLGIIGCGEVAIDDADAVELAPNACLAACFDVDQRLAADLADRHGAWAAPSADAVLESDQIDAVILCVPHHLHEPLAGRAAAAGKHVIVEKPMAIDLESAVRMLRTAERAGVALSVCFPQRYRADVGMIRERLRQQAIGRLAGVEVRWFADKPGSYFYGGFTGRSPSTWRMRRDLAGGGVLLMNLCHDVELVRHLVGARVEEVMAVTANVNQRAEVEESVSVSVSYEGGAMGSFVASAAARGLRHETSMRIWGTDGQVEIKPRSRLYTLRQLDGLPAGEWVTMDGRHDPSRQAVLVSRLISRFASAVGEGRTPDVSAFDGLAVQAFIQAAYDSAPQGRSVRPADLLKRAGVDAEEAL